MSRLWQNLIYQKCPDCDTRFNKIKTGYTCQGCGFYLSQEKIIEILKDKNHACNRFASQEQREFIINFLSKQ